MKNVTVMKQAINTKQQEPTLAKAHDLRGLLQEVELLKAQLSVQAEIIEDLERQATRDDMTGLVNRRGFEADLDEAMHYSRRYNREGALLLIDLNDFKTVNDTLGHQAGDAILVHVAKILKAHTRTSDVVARIGGDEFCVILREAGEEEARLKRKELEAVIAAVPCSFGGHDIYASASIGACTFHEANHKQDLIEKADASMYQNKASRRSVGCEQARL